MDLPGDRLPLTPLDFQTAETNSRAQLMDSLRLLLALKMPLAGMVMALLSQGADPLETMAAGAAFWPDQVSRFRWLRAWLTPETLDRTGLHVHDWAPVLAASTIHPLSLPLSARTQEELAGYLDLGLASYLPGQLELLITKWDFVAIGHQGTVLAYRGDGQDLRLPEGLVIDSALSLEDWKVPGGWPRRFRCAGPLSLENCSGKLGFPSGFRVEQGFRASHCTGLCNLPRGPVPHIKLHDCDLTAIPDRDHLKALTLVGCRRLASLGALPDLERLALTRCPAVNVLPPFPKLQNLFLGSIPQLPEFQAGPALREVRLSFVKRLQSLPAECAAVPKLSLEGLERLGSLENLRNPMESLSILNCPSLASLPAGLRAVRLSLSGTNLRPLPADLQVTDLQIDRCPGLRIP